MGDVHRIGKANPPGVDNVLSMLEEAKGEVLRTGADKCMVIMVKEITKGGEDVYETKYLNAGFKKSEQIAALDITKSDIHEEMRS
jgi:hypothetical protein